MALKYTIFAGNFTLEFMLTSLILLTIGLFIIAALYSSVGHGGASGYLAVFAIANYSTAFLKQDVLILNLIVSAIAFVQYYRKGYFQLKLFLPLVLGSIPLAFLGGKVQMDVDVYKRILGVLLLIPAALFLIDIKNKEREIKNMPIVYGVLIGAVLGFISGLTGIGGGVFLSPILILCCWANQKQTAAISAPFIFVNSAAGLLGTFKTNQPIDSSIIIFIAVIVLGGLIGSGYGAGKLNPGILKKLLAVVLIIASYKLLRA